MDRKAIIESARKSFILDETDHMLESFLLWSEEINRMADKLMADVEELQKSVLALAKQFGEEE